MFNVKNKDAVWIAIYAQAYVNYLEEDARGGFDDADRAKARKYAEDTANENERDRRLDASKGD